MNSKGENRQNTQAINPKYGEYGDLNTVGKKKRWKKDRLCLSQDSVTTKQQYSTIIHIYKQIKNFIYKNHIPIYCVSKINFNFYDRNLDQP